MKFSIKDFFSKCDQICRKLRFWSHLLKKSLIENFMFCSVKRKMPARFLKSCIFAKTEPSISREITIKNFHSAFQNISCSSCDIEVTCITAQKMKLCLSKFNFIVLWYRNFEYKLTYMPSNKAMSNYICLMSLLLAANRTNKLFLRSLI